MRLPIRTPTRGRPDLRFLLWIVLIVQILRVSQVLLKRVEEGNLAQQFVEFRVHLDGDEEFMNHEIREPSHRLSERVSEQVGYRKRILGMYVQEQRYRKQYKEQRA
jgi:hypothetical protein